MTARKKTTALLFMAALCVVAGAASAQEYTLDGKVYGLAGAEKAVATVMYAFAGKVPPAPAKPAPTKAN